MNAIFSDYLEQHEAMAHWFAGPWDIATLATLKPEAISPELANTLHEQAAAYGAESYKK